MPDRCRSTLLDLSLMGKIYGTSVGVLSHGPQFVSSGTCVVLDLNWSLDRFIQCKRHHSLRSVPSPRLASELHASVLLKMKKLWLTRVN